MARRLPVLAFRPAGEVVRGATGEVLDGLDAVLAEFDQHRHGHAVDLEQAVLDAEFLALGVMLGLDHGEIIARPGLQLLRGLLVEAFDRGDLGLVHMGELLDRAEALRSEELARPSHPR